MPHEMQRYRNGHLARPLPQRREPERVRVPDAPDWQPTFTLRDVVRTIVVWTAVCTIVAGAILTLYAFTLEAMLRAAAGG